jgi:GDP-mannose 6-dehydrogenase
MTMRVSVFGLGYVGCVSAASFASDGHEVVGVDVNPGKVAAINEGRSPIVEKGLEELIREMSASGTLRATTSAIEAVAATSVSLLCVGTPSRRNGSLDLSYLARVCEEIGDALRDKPEYHVVVVRSTVLPGTTYDVVIPALERRSGKKYGKEFGVAVNPEFLREGTALHDFRNPPLTLVGSDHTADAAATVRLYDGVDAPLQSTSIRTAEMIKYASNTWHALKVCFANEIGNLCKRLDIDSHDVMEIFCQDQKLNLGSYYLKPGFAFGGSCLPKDVRALQYRAKEVDVEMPVIESILDSNRLQVQHALELIVETGSKRVGLLGFSFKAGTDDLRESPIVILGEMLLGKGYTLCIYDRNVSLARLVGANKEYIERQIPHLSSLLCETIDDVIVNCDVIVVGNKAPEFDEALTRTRTDQTIIDLVRVRTDLAAVAARYEGICWGRPAAAETTVAG